MAKGKSAHCTVRSMAYFNKQKLVKMVFSSTLKLKGYFVKSMLNNGICFLKCVFTGRMERNIIVTKMR